MGRSEDQVRETVHGTASRAARTRSPVRLLAVVKWLGEHLLSWQTVSAAIAVLMGVWGVMLSLSEFTLANWFFGISAFLLCAKIAAWEEVYTKSWKLRITILAASIGSIGILTCMNFRLVESKRTSARTNQQGPAVQAPAKINDGGKVPLPPAGSGNPPKQHGTSILPSGLVIAGQVVDAVSNEPIAGVEISFERRMERFITDDDGNFRVTLPRSVALDQVRLIARKENYKPRDVIIRPPIESLIIQMRRVT